MNILLTHVPEEIKKIVKDLQAREKESKGIKQYSFSSTVYKIIREWSQKK